MTKPNTPWSLLLDRGTAKECWVTLRGGVDGQLVLTIILNYGDDHFAYNQVTIDPVLNVQTSPAYAEWLRRTEVIYHATRNSSPKVRSNHQEKERTTPRAHVHNNRKPRRTARRDS